MANIYSAEVEDPEGKRRYFFGLLGPVQKRHATVTTARLPDGLWMGVLEAGGQMRFAAKTREEELGPRVDVAFADEQDILDALREVFGISHLEAVANSFIDG